MTGNVPPAKLVLATDNTGKPKRIFLCTRDSAHAARAQADPGSIIGAPQTPWYIGLIDAEPGDTVEIRLPRGVEVIIIDQTQWLTEATEAIAAEVRADIAA